MKFYNIYILDIFFRSIYVLISFCLCWIIFFHYRETLFLLEVLPIIMFLTQKRLIATQLIHLFNIIWFLCTILSFIFIFPLVIYIINYFFSSSWYKYQLNLYTNILVKFSQIFSIIYVFNQLFLLPQLVAFLLYWEILDDYSLIKVEAEIALFFYIKWAFNFKFLFSFLVALLFLLIYSFFYFLFPKKLYFMLTNQKKIFIFCFIILFMFLIPPDFLIQIILSFSVLLTIEFFLFFICIKVYFNIKN